MPLDITEQMIPTKVHAKLLDGFTKWVSGLGKIVQWASQEKVSVEKSNNGLSISKGKVGGIFLLTVA